MSNEISTQKPASPVAAFSKMLDRMKPQMTLALPKHMSADRMARLALTAFSTNKQLQVCKADSILASLMTATQLGLEPGINGQGYLIPYKDTCTFVPGWKGLVDLVSRAGRATVWTGAVYEGDKFDYQLGDEPFCRHKPGDSEGNFTHVYAIGRVKDAQMPVIEVWTRGKVKKHLAQYNKVGGRHYAMASESNLEMYARKVALLQVLKYMPSSIELANAITVSHAAEAGQGAVIEGDFVTINSEAVDPETGEIQGSGAEPSALPEYTDEQFAKNLPGWRGLIETGRKTADEIIDMASSKARLTDDQIAMLRATVVEGE
jgi:recombination protein RecT